MAPPISSTGPRSVPLTHSSRASETPRASPTSPAPRPSPTHDLHRDAFVSDGAMRDRMAHATGRGLVDQVENGRFVAERMAARPVDWAHPAETLAHHSQLDASDATRGDTSRCGATALVGGILMSGPEAPRRLDEARTRVRARLDDVDDGLAARGTHEWSRPTGATAFTGMAEASEAHRMLSGLPADTSTWTHADVSRFEEASYRLGRAEQALHGDTATSGLTGAEMVRMRETLWGSDWHPTTADGHPVDVVFSGTRDTGGAAALNHFVLGTDDLVSGGRRGVVYDPWPENNGSNFIRPDAPTAADERLLGGLERSTPYATADGARPGIDLDFWRPLAAED